MADLFRDGAFPRRIDRIVIRTEAIMYLLGGLLLIFIISDGPPPREKATSPFRVAIEIIASDAGIISLGVAAIIIGAGGLWAVSKKGKKKWLEHVIFGYFLIRLYALLAVLMTYESLADTRWISHLPWVVIWASYWLVLRIRADE